MGMTQTEESGCYKPATTRKVLPGNARGRSLRSLVKLSHGESV